jgi:hypothetical protein
MISWLHGFRVSLKVRFTFLSLIHLTSLSGRNHTGWFWRRRLQNTKGTRVLLEYLGIIFDVNYY